MKALFFLLCLSVSMATADESSLAAVKAEDTARVAVVRAAALTIGDLRHKLRPIPRRAAFLQTAEEAIEKGYLGETAAQCDV